MAKTYRKERTESKRKGKYKRSTKLTREQREQLTIKYR